MWIRRLALALALAMVLLLATPAWAQPYPHKPVTLVVGFAPGGASDIIARQIAAKLSQRLGHSVIVDNRAGAGGTIAAAAVARAAPDGHTLLFASASALSVSPWVMKSVSYETSKDFVPVIELVRGYYLLNGTPKLEVRNLQELRAYATRNPGQLACGSAGPGTIHHLSCEMLSLALNTPMVHVPFKGSAPALQALMAGDIQIMFEGVPTPVPMIQSGRVRGLAFSGPRRLDVLPDVPTFSEQGLASFDVSFWFGVVAPVGAPKHAVEQLNAAINKVLKDPETIAVFEKQGVEIAGGSAAAFGQKIATEYRQWGEVAKQARIQPE